MGMGNNKVALCSPYMLRLGPIEGNFLGENRADVSSLLFGRFLITLALVSGMNSLVLFTDYACSQTFIFPCIQHAPQIVEGTEFREFLKPEHKHQKRSSAWMIIHEKYVPEGKKEGVMKLHLRRMYYEASPSDGKGARYLETTHGVAFDQDEIENLFANLASCISKTIPPHLRPHEYEFLLEWARLVAGSSNSIGDVDEYFEKMDEKKIHLNFEKMCQASGEIKPGKLEISMFVNDHLSLVRDLALAYVTQRAFEQALTALGGPDGDDDDDDDEVGFSQQLEGHTGLYDGLGAVGKRRAADTFEGGEKKKPKC